MSSNNNRSGSSGNADIQNNKNFLSPDQSREFQTKIDSSNRATRMLLIGCLLMVVTSSASPNYLGHLTRLTSFTDRIDSATAERWALSGFHWHDAGVRCCHCGGHADNLQQDPEKWHFKQQVAGCYLNRMLQLLMPNMDSVTDAEMASVVSKFERTFKQFFSLIKDSAFGFVESFGFSADKVELALLKHLVHRDSLADGVPKFPRTGKLIKLLQCLSETELHYSDFVVGLIKSKIFEFYYSSDSSYSPNTQHIRIPNQHLTPHQLIVNEICPPTGQATNRAMQIVEIRAREDSLLCLMCGRHQRDRVLLPCGHLKFCHLCVQQMQACHVCGGNIFCVLTAFLC